MRFSSITLGILFGFVPGKVFTLWWIVGWIFGICPWQGFHTLGGLLSRLLGFVRGKVFTFRVDFWLGYWDLSLVRFSSITLGGLLGFVLGQAFKLWVDCWVGYWDLSLARFSNFGWIVGLAIGICPW